MVQLVVRIKRNYQKVRICKRPGCDDLVHAKDLCRFHYDEDRYERGIADKHGKRIAR